MRGGEHEVTRAYVLYRERRAQERAQDKSQKRGKAESTAMIVMTAPCAARMRTSMPLALTC